MSTETLKRNTRHISFVHGLEDDFVPSDMTRKSFEACTGEKSLLLVEGATHGTSFLHNKEQYLQQIDWLLCNGLNQESNL